jgi:hypothetical protein
VGDKERCRSRNDELWIYIPERGDFEEIGGLTIDKGKKGEQRTGTDERYGCHLL